MTDTNRLEALKGYYESPGFLGRHVELADRIQMDKTGAESIQSPRNISASEKPRSADCETLNLSWVWQTSFLMKS